MVKNPPANSGDQGLDPWVGKIPWEEDINPLQYSCQENTIDRVSLAVRWSICRGRKESRHTEWLHTHTPAGDWLSLEPTSSGCRDRPVCASGFTRAVNLSKVLHNQLASILEYGTTEHEGIHFNMKWLKTFVTNRLSYKEKELHPDKIDRVKINCKKAFC